MDGWTDGWMDVFGMIIIFGKLMGVISHWWVEDAKMLNTGFNTGSNESLVVRTYPAKHLDEWMILN